MTDFGVNVRNITVFSLTVDYDDHLLLDRGSAIFLPVVSVQNVPNAMMMMMMIVTNIEIPNRTDSHFLIIGWPDSEDFFNT